MTTSEDSVTSMTRDESNTESVATEPNTTKDAEPVAKKVESVSITDTEYTTEELPLRNFEEG